MKAMEELQRCVEDGVTKRGGLRKKKKKKKKKKKALRKMKLATMGRREGPKSGEDAGGDP